MFNANQPKDVLANPIQAGWYRIQDRRTVRLGEVFETEDTTLWIRFVGGDRPQRVDELSQFLEWTPAEQSEVDEANGASRSAWTR